MVKADVDLRTDSLESLQVLIKQWLPSATVASYQIMRGGFSGTNYKITVLHDGDGESTYALKICNGYTAWDVEQQAQCTAYLAAHNFAEFCCYSLPVQTSSSSSSSSAASQQFTALTEDGQPATLLNFVHGRAADHVIEVNPSVTAVSVLRCCGQQLSHLHRIVVDDASRGALRSYTTGGACLIGLHVRGHFTSMFADTTDDYILQHPYLPFYRAHVPHLVADVQGGELPLGVLHGDPFLDNILIDEGTGAFRGFVDWEDVCIGPLLFDVACCAVGNCFDEKDHLRMDHLEALLDGYQRPLTADEVRLFVPFLKHALLCNATWRFVNFNITHPHLRAEFGTKYAQLQSRLEHIESPEVARSIGAAVAHVAVTATCR